MLELILGIYCVWALFSGWKFMSGKIDFLENKALVSIFLKLCCSFIVGLFYGVIYFVVLILKFLGVMDRL